MKKAFICLALLTSTLSLAGTLTEVGRGTREKKFFVIWVAVYDAILSVSEPVSFVRDTTGSRALDSLKNMKQRAIELKFKRSVSGEDVVNGFDAALEVNHIADSKSMREFKTAILSFGNIDSGESITLLVDLDKSTLVCTKGSKSVSISGDNTFFQNVFSMWLGKAADTGLEALRTKLITG